MYFIGLFAYIGCFRERFDKDFKILSKPHLGIATINASAEGLGTSDGPFTLLI